MKAHIYSTPEEASKRIVLLTRIAADLQRKYTEIQQRIDGPAENKSEETHALLDQHRSLIEELEEMGFECLSFNPVRLVCYGEHENRIVHYLWAPGEKKITRWKNCTDTINVSNDLQPSKVRV
jgi:hypothetical protein